MRTRNPFVMLALALALTGAAACEDDDGGDESPPVIGDGEDGTPEDGTPEDGTPEDGTPEDGTPEDGTPDDGDNGDGGDGCIEEPETSLELLNNCAPAGVERRAFDNAERLPASYTPGQPLPALD
jgi:hypothetical protein